MLDLPKEILAPIIGGVVTIVGSVWSINSSRRAERRQQIEAERRERLAEIYNDFLSFFNGKLSGAIDKEGNVNPVAKSELDRWMEKALLWGSDEFVQAFSELLSEFRALTREQGQFGPAQMRQYANLVKVMRTDLGHQNRGVTDEVLLHLQLQDWDEYSSGD